MFYSVYSTILNYIIYTYILVFHIVAICLGSRMSNTLWSGFLLLSGTAAVLALAGLSLFGSSPKV